ncbi:MAG: hypothetical protein ACE5EI_01335 [Thermodesulfobacteriota bacterium]
MRKFEVCIRGRNFLIKRDGKVKRTGFYSARFVEADDMSVAVGLAMDSLRDALADVVVNDPSDPPVMNVEDVEEVYFFEENMLIGERVVPGNGFLWDE